jgi:glycosyltransferase involved in cell wall biosynthesis
VTVFTRRYSGRPYRQRQDGYLIRRRNELPVSGLRMVWDNFPAVWNIAHHRPRPQVLLCYQTLNSGLIGVIAQTLLGIPAVVSIRGNNEYRLRLSTMNRLLVPGIYRRARQLIVQSPRILDDLHTQLRSADQAVLSDQLRRKTKVIPNGIHISPDARSNGTKVVYVGRLIQKKGVADLLLAAHQLPGVEVLIVGDGPDRERLEALAKGLPVTFVGQARPSTVVDYLQQARVLVLPSYLGDGLPNVILEAMACGVPVVATHTAGIPDLVQHGETGFLFAPGDVDQMISHIDHLLKDDTLWRSLAQHSLKAVQPYSWDVITPQIEQLLLDVISQ